MTNSLSQDVIRDLAIFELRRVPINQLSGIRKSHRLPDDRDALQRFVVQSSTAEMDCEIDDVYARLRDQLEFRRREIRVSGPNEGYCLVSVPGFDVEIGLAVDADESGWCVWRRAVTGIRQTKWLVGERLQSLFIGPVNGLQIAMDDALRLDQLIDHAENRTPRGLTVDYDRGATWCDLAFDDIPIRIRIQDEQIIASTAKRGSICELISNWVNFQQRFLATR